MEPNDNSGDSWYRREALENGMIADHWYKKMSFWRAIALVLLGFQAIQLGLAIYLYLL